MGSYDASAQRRQGRRELGSLPQGQPSAGPGSIAIRKHQRWASSERMSIETEWNRRDVTSRRFTVTTTEVFLEADPRRASDHHLIPQICGHQYGARWRRDDDEVAGRWRVTWIPITSELVLEHELSEAVWLLGRALRSHADAVGLLGPLTQRQNERNSLALVLDAYEQFVLQGDSAAR